MTISQLADRCRQSSLTTGTGALVLGPVDVGFRSLASAYAPSVDLPYTIEGLDAGGNLNGQWEVGRGHLNGLGQLERDAVYASSNGGSLVNFTSAALRVFVTGSAGGLGEWLNSALATRVNVAGPGLTGGGDASAGRTFSVGANLDGSIIVNADDIQIGVLATDGQHGARGGGGLHATFSTLSAGFVPAPGLVAGKFLRDDGTWSTVPVAVTTMAAIGSSPNANGATISGALLNLEPASASFGGVVTTGAQVFAGAKTFNDGIVLGTPLPIASGGTGETSASAAINALVPSQSGNNGRFLTTDGSAVSWAAVIGMAIGNTVVGSTVGSVLFVGSTNLLAQDNANLFWDDTGNVLSIGTASGNERLTVSGRLSLAETTAPTSTAGFGKFWAETSGDSVGSRFYLMGDATSTAQLVQLAGQSDTLGTGGNVTLDFSPSLSWNRVISPLTANITFATSNLGIGRSMTVFITGGASPFTASFPVDWNWLTPVPPTIAANDVGVLTLFSMTTNDAGIVAAWSYENAPPTPIGSGAASRVAYWVSSTEISDDDDLFFDGANFAVGTTSPTARAHLVGSQARSITTVSTNTTLDATHHTVKVDATGGARTITLPAAAASAGVVYIIKKIDASANTVTVDGNASETIDGATTYVLSVQYAAVKIHCDGSSWWVIP
jgi:hypothetical protein